jgi:hypothetical protein
MQPETLRTFRVGLNPRMPTEAGDTTINSEQKMPQTAHL